MRCLNTLLLGLLAVGVILISPKFVSAQGSVPPLTYERKTVVVDCPHPLGIQLAPSCKPSIDAAEANFKLQNPGFEMLAPVDDGISVAQYSSTQSPPLGNSKRWLLIFQRTNLDTVVAAYKANADAARASAQQQIQSLTPDLKAAIDTAIANGSLKAADMDMLEQAVRERLKSEFSDRIKNLESTISDLKQQIASLRAQVPNPPAPASNTPN